MTPQASRRNRQRASAAGVPCLESYFGTRERNRANVEFEGGRHMCLRKDMGCELSIEKKLPKRQLVSSFSDEKNGPRLRR